MEPIRTSIRVRLSAFLLVAALAAGPLSTHIYWLLGGTWGLHSADLGDRVVEEGSTSTGIRVVAAMVVVLLLAAISVVLARVGIWRQTFLPATVIRVLAWALAAVFLLETVAAFTWGRAPEWWMYGPVSLLIGALALAVAGSGLRRQPRNPSTSDYKKEAPTMSVQFAGKYVSLTTFRRDGTPVSTPVWFISENGHLLVETDADSYKVKRIRRNENVTVATCTAAGRATGEAVAGRAALLPSDELPRVERLLQRKYRLDYIFVLPIYLLVQRLRGKPLRYEKPVILSITPSQHA